ncbi:hypothetical protein CISIN_1g042975mg [Citrus sinensis]|uniref:Uncharacterized protein n=1 Tax=Citrus sinensis TaxID=2711 RepID=A0A067E020_CITSI|nr:hypothetical protein CISIN_1g042975mg [Citrus sinensis]
MSFLDLPPPIPRLPSHPLQNLVSLNGALLYLKNLYVFFFIAWRQWILIGWSEKAFLGCRRCQGGQATYVPPPSYFLIVKFCLVLFGINGVVPLSVTPKPELRRQI